MYYLLLCFIEIRGIPFEYLGKVEYVTILIKYNTPAVNKTPPCDIKLLMNTGRVVKFYGRTGACRTNEGKVNTGVQFCYTQRLSFIKP